jgi:DNA-binding CsgD family transcriptional regulator
VTERLSEREREVLVLISKGASNLEIADRLDVSERTVKGHVTGILEKLGAHDRAGAVARGFDLGLLKASGAAGPGIPPKTRAKRGFSGWFLKLASPFFHPVRRYVATAPRRKHTHSGLRGFHPGGQSPSILERKGLSHGNRGL